MPRGLILTSRTCNGVAARLAVDFGHGPPIRPASWKGSTGFLAGRLGLSPKGARVLSVQGRRSLEWHGTPVNPLTFEGRCYLVAPRGETQWVRNIRVSRTGRLTAGGKTEEVRVEEVPEHEKPPILCVYLREWAWEVKQVFGNPLFRILPGP